MSEDGGTPGGPGAAGAAIIITVITYVVFSVAALAYAGIDDGARKPDQLGPISTDIFPAWPATPSARTGP